MQSITTKFLGPTNARGSRIKATTTSGKSVTLSWAYELNGGANHDLAAKTLAEKLGWKGKWYSASVKDGGYVYVCLGEYSDPAFVIEKGA